MHAHDGCQCQWAGRRLHLFLYKPARVPHTPHPTQHGGQHPCCTRTPTMAADVEALVELGGAGAGVTVREGQGGDGGTLGVRSRAVGRPTRADQRVPDGLLDTLGREGRYKGQGSAPWLTRRVTGGAAHWGGYR